MGSLSVESNCRTSHAKSPLFHAVNWWVMLRLCWRGHKWKSESAEFKRFRKEVLGVSLYLLPLCHSDQQWFILTQTGSICEVCELLSVLYWLRFGFSQPVLYHATKTRKIKQTAGFNDAIVALLIMKTSQKLWSRCCKRPWSNPGLFSVASAFFLHNRDKVIPGQETFLKWGGPTQFIVVQEAVSGLC